MMNTKSVAMLMMVLMVLCEFSGTCARHHHHHSPSPSPSPDSDSPSPSPSPDSDSPSPSPDSAGKETYCVLGCSIHQCFLLGINSNDWDKFGSCIKECSEQCKRNNKSDDIYV
ncbi:PREDICTED: early nodulin-55-1-like [Camelina sativa]|uniref:Early nodulin-55-1-like n=1 Tax=Camelina sativa TaxID=90675 RepID=A0ABM0SZB5_CAMSA|nr:PREDICTED: early nodulin-55-1-like [Camelina sativa]